ncbi:MAG: TetR/AcrR family transcriptional regulator [Lentisphaeria bacterium]
MSIVVDHESRKHEIALKALKLFSERGYQVVTYRHIAERCGLSRTLLYKYFKNKREIFDSAIMLIVYDIAVKFRKTVENNPGLSASEKLDLVLGDAARRVVEHPQLLQVIAEYLIRQRRQGEDVARKVKRHTVALRRTIKQLIREGVASGEFLRAVNCNQLSDLLYSILEAAGLRISITDSADLDEIRASYRLVIAAMRGNYGREK